MGAGNRANEFWESQSEEDDDARPESHALEDPLVLHEEVQLEDSDCEDEPQNPTKKRNRNRTTPYGTHEKLTELNNYNYRITRLTALFQSLSLVHPYADYICIIKKPTGRSFIAVSPSMQSVIESDTGKALQYEIDKLHTRPAAAPVQPPGSSPYLDRFNIDDVELPSDRNARMSLWTKAYQEYRMNAQSRSTRSLLPTLRAIAKKHAVPTPPKSPDGQEFSGLFQAVMKQETIPTLEIWNMSDKYSDHLKQVNLKCYVNYMKLLDFRARILNEPELPRTTTTGAIIDIPNTVFANDVDTEATTAPVTANAEASSVDAAGLTPVEPIVCLNVTDIQALSIPHSNAEASSVDAAVLTPFDNITLPTSLVPVPAETLFANDALGTTATTVVQAKAGVANALKRPRKSPLQNLISMDSDSDSDSSRHSDETVSTDDCFGSKSVPETAPVAKKPCKNHAKGSISSEEVYEVEKILSTKVIKGERRYLIKWVGYNKKSDNTWQLKKDLNCRTIFAKFVKEWNAKHPNDLLNEQIK